MPLDLNSLPMDKIRAFCMRHGVTRLAIFGSALRDDFTSESDIDVLVELTPGMQVGLIGFQRMEEELSKLLDRAVDLNTPGFLSRYFRDRVLAEAENLYVAA